MKVNAIAPLVGRYRSFSDSVIEMSSNKGVAATPSGTSLLEQVLLKVGFEFCGLTFKIRVHSL